MLKGEGERDGEKGNRRKGEGGKGEGGRERK